MIPKVIHYCWFGGNEIPPLGKKCIMSWKKYCPDYEIIEWNESNYDYKKIPYIQEAYEEKKWAFVSDYVRLDVIYQYGGIYLDIDVELLQNIDFLLDYRCFLATEADHMIGTGVGFGAEKNDSNIKLMMDMYQGIHFRLDHNLFDLIPCPHRNTLPFKKMGYQPSDKIQHLNNAVIFPPEYFCPLDYETKELNITENTVAIHHYNASWITREEREFEEKVKKYRENHCKFKSILYRKYCEYQMHYDSFRWKYILEFVYNKIKRKRNRLSQKL